VEVCEEVKLVVVAALFALAEFRRDVVEPPDEINTLREIPLRRIPEVVDCALPFEQRTEKIDLLQGRVLTQRH
jgi:hypothetical protein